MGQGNAIAHLMPPPFYAYRYVVAKARAPEESIQDQIEKIRDEGPDPYKRYKIEVMPGNYAEVITMYPYIDVVAPYGKVIIQPPANGNVAVTMASNCMLQGFEVNMTSIKTESGATGIVIEAANDNVIVEDCWVTGGTADNIGISDASTNNNINIRRCRIDSAATGYNKTGTGTTWFYDNRVTATTRDIDVDAGTLTLVECELMGTATNVDVGVTGVLLTTTVNSWGNTLSGTGWVIADDAGSAHAAVYSHDDRYTAVSHAGAGFMVDYESPQSYNVFDGMHVADALTDITDAGDLKRYVILVHPGEYDEAITMKAHIDLVGESNQSCVIKQTNATVLNPAANSRIRSMRIELTGAEGVRCIEVDAVAARLEDCIVTVAGVSEWNHGIHTMNGGTVTLYDCHVTCSGTAAYALTLTNPSTSTLYNSSFSGSDDTYDIFLTSNAAVDAYNCQLLNTGWYIGDYANVFGRAYNCDFTEVTFEGTNGAFADLSGCRLYDCDSGVLIGEWVYIESDPTCHAEEAKADSLATMPAMGVVVYKPDGAAGTTCYVKNYGYLYDVAANWTCGEEYWISATAEGEITTTMAPVWPQRAGVATSTQRFKILIGDNLGLVHCNEYLCLTGAVDPGQWVYKTGANDLVGLADSDAAATMQAIGVCVAVLVVDDPNDTILVKLRGKNSVSDTTAVWVASDDVYISATAGAITNIIPGGIIQKVAEVKHYTSPTLIYEIAD